MKPFFMLFCDPVKFVQGVEMKHKLSIAMKINNTSKNKAEKHSNSKNKMDHLVNVITNKGSKNHLYI